MIQKSIDRETSLEDIAEKKPWRSSDAPVYP
jgi:hypothetical protein